MVTDEKGQTKNMYLKRNQKSNHCAKNVLQCRILKGSKTDMNGGKVQTTVDWARTGTKRCNAKTGKFVYLWYKFRFNKTEYLQLFMGFENQKQKHVFPKT